MKFAEKHLLNEDFDSMITKVSLEENFKFLMRFLQIAFLNMHELVNQVFLHALHTIVIVVRNDTSKALTNPVKVNRILSK